MWNRPTHKGKERWWGDNWRQPVRRYPRRGRPEGDFIPLFYVMFGVWITLMFSLIQHLGQP